MNVHGEADDHGTVKHRAPGATPGRYRMLGAELLRSVAYAVLHPIGVMSRSNRPGDQAPAEADTTVVSGRRGDRPPTAMASDLVGSVSTPRRPGRSPARFADAVTAVLLPPSLAPGPAHAPSLSQHHLAASTHTVELSQFAEINVRLRDEDEPAITAGILGLAGAPWSSAGRTGELSPEAVLVRLSADGPPEYPYLYGGFAEPGRREVVGAARSRVAPGECLVVQMHSLSLRALSRALGLRHSWGL